MKGKGGGRMPYKDSEKRKEYHNKYYKKYNKERGQIYRKITDINKSIKIKEWKECGALLYKFHRLQKIYGKLGIDVFLRDNCQCVECGEPDFRVLVLHHIIPKSEGGGNSEDNLTTLCENCHVRRHFGDSTKCRGYKTTQQVWDTHWMGFAKFLGRYSPCLSRQIGGVLVKDNDLLSVGWNGPPKEIGSCSKRNPNNEEICPRKLVGAKSGEQLDLCFAVHTEVACIINAANNGKNTKDAVLYIDCSIPCKNCLVAIINSGIERVVCNIKGSNTSNFGIFYDKSSEYIYNQSGLLIDFVEVESLISDGLYKN